jgi:hypothetical protein
LKEKEQLLAETAVAVAVEEIQVFLRNGKDYKFLIGETDTSVFLAFFLCFFFAV